MLSSITPRPDGDTKTLSFAPSRARSQHLKFQPAVVAATVGRRSQSEAPHQRVTTLSSREKKALEEKYLRWGPVSLTTKSDVLAFFASFGVLLTEQELPAAAPKWWRGYLRFEGSVSAPPLVLDEVFHVMEREKRSSAVFLEDHDELLATFVSLGGADDKSGYANVTVLVDAAKQLGSLTSSSTSAGATHHHHPPPRRFGSLSPHGEAAFNPEALFMATDAGGAATDGGHDPPSMELPFPHFVELMLFLRSAMSGWSEGGNSRRTAQGALVNVVAGSPSDADLDVVLTTLRSRASAVSRSTLGGGGRGLLGESRFLLDNDRVDEGSMRLESSGYSPSVSKGEPSMFFDDDEFDDPHVLESYNPMNESTGESEKLRELQQRITTIVKENAAHRSRLLAPLAGDERAILNGEPLDPHRYEKSVLDPDGELAEERRKAKVSFSRRPLTKPIEPTLMLRDRLKQQLLEAQFELDLTTLKQNKSKDNQKKRPMSAQHGPRPSSATPSCSSSNVSGWNSTQRHPSSASRLRASSSLADTSNSSNNNNNPINSFVSSVARCAIKHGLKSNVTPQGGRGPVAAAMAARAHKTKPTATHRAALVDRFAEARNKALDLTVRLNETLERHTAQQHHHHHQISAMEPQQQQQQQKESVSSDQTHIELPPQDFVANAARPMSALRYPGPDSFSRK